MLIIWWIIGIVFVLPALTILGLIIANRFSKGRPEKAINALWLLLLVMLALFLGFGLFQGVR
jgi:hypothetical protein